MQSEVENKENIDNHTLKQEQTEASTQKSDQKDVLWVGNSKSGNVDLRANFERFKKQKVEQIKYRKYVTEQSISDKKDPAVKKRLREKFLETAKKYFGVPYAKRYWQPGEPLYDAPMFLDCCALTRQITYDMREELGFYLDRWNQAYQYDTLPIDLKFEEMQPGDLIFYSGIYYNTKLRPQRHNMVHVEIFTGGPTGEQSIGARWQRGVVQYFDSYKFESKAYHSIQFHYKSIDTWLEGICRSWCSTHEWKNWNLFWVPDKKSIFSSEEIYDENDMDAPLIDDEEIDSDPSVNKEGAKKVKPIAQESNQCFIGQGNNPRLAKDSLSQYGLKPMANGMQFSDKYRFKWTQTSSEINYVKFREGEHIVNHISNAKIFTNKITTLDVLEYLKIALENGSVQSTLRLKDFFPETYRLDIAADLVKFLNSPSEGLWLAKKSQSNQGKGIKLISDVKKYKEDLLTIKEDKEDIPDSTKLLMDKLKQMGISEGDATTEVAEEVKTEEPVSEQKKKKWNNMNLLAKELKELVVQKYQENPLLVDGRKFDIRAFMIVICMKPYLVLYNPGYVRMSLNPFSTEDFEKNKITHLTNNSVQKNHPDFKALKEKSIISIDDLIQDLTERGKIQGRDEYMSRVDARIQEIMKLVFITVKDKLDRKFGCFELFGFDFLVDDNLNPFLIEINTNPALFTDTLVQKELLPKLVDDIVKMALGVHKFGKTEGKEEVEELLKNGLTENQLKYDVVFSELQ